MTNTFHRPTFWVIIPPPIWALILILAAWLGGRAAGLEPFFRHVVAGWAIFAAGFAVSASGRLAFAKAGTEAAPASKKNSHLVTSGPFAITRNPMYLGILIAVSGLSVAIGTVAGPVATIIFFIFVNFVSIPYEEAKMEAQFGEDFRAYKMRVRRWL